MKEINLLSIVQAYENMSDTQFVRYLDYFNTSLKKDERQDLKLFIKEFNKSDKEIDSLDGYFLSYEIPQISKEFDLLRFGENYNVNIELKQSATPEKIKQQLERNKYYLSFLGGNIISFAFTSDNKKLFRLDNSNNLIEENFRELSKVLQAQIRKETTNIDSLFNPSNYLVSPFNSTDEFVNEKYFLTSQQEEIKTEVLKKINKEGASFTSISGKAGTGKTLLTYDIANECKKKGSNVLIIHCGLLNDGHYKLRDEYKWDIIPIKFLYTVNLSDYSLIIIDEVQRIYLNQLIYTIDKIKQYAINCIFSYDNSQCLRTEEINNNIEEHINTNAKPKSHELTKKIRTNKDIAYFITAILNKKTNPQKFDKSNIELCYFKTPSEAKEYVLSMKSKNWKTINYTPSKRQSLPYDEFHMPNEDNSHKVIGQEFDKVVVIIDSHFHYQENGRLSTRNYNDTPYYHPTKMLLQNMTRTRRKLSIIIIDNDELLDRCLTIFEGNQLKPYQMAEFSKEWIEKENNGMKPDFSINQIFKKLKNGEVMPVICEGFGITKVINDNDVCYVELKGDVLPFNDIILVDNPN